MIIMEEMDKLMDSPNTTYLKSMSTKRGCSVWGHYFGTFTEHCQRGGASRN